MSEFDVSEKVKQIITDSGLNIKKVFFTLPAYEDNVSNNEDEVEECDGVCLSLEQEDVLFKHHTCFAHT